MVVWYIGSKKSTSDLEFWGIVSINGRRLVETSSPFLDSSSTTPPTTSMSGPPLNYQTLLVTRPSVLCSYTILVRSTVIRSTRRKVPKPRSVDSSPTIRPTEDLRKGRDCKLLVHVNGKTRSTPSKDLRDTHTYTHTVSPLLTIYTLFIGVGFSPTRKHTPTVFRPT